VQAFKLFQVLIECGYSIVLTIFSKHIWSSEKSRTVQEIRAKEN